MGAFGGGDLGAGQAVVWRGLEWGDVQRSVLIMRIVLERSDCHSGGGVESMEYDVGLFHVFTDDVVLEHHVRLASYELLLKCPSIVF